jgi:hypothetical protein
MTREIRVGTILLEDRPAINSALEIESEPFSGGWGILKTVGASALELKVGAAGWRCFFLAGEVKATVFGPLAIANSHRALRRILSKTRDQNFNCLEVTRIAKGRFLGIPYTTVGAHSRHVQLEWLLQGTKARRIAQTDADWARG